METNQNQTYPTFMEGKKYAEHVDADGDEFSVIWTCIRRTKTFATFQHRGEIIKAKIRDYGTCEWVRTDWLNIKAREEVE